jgi:predicted nucleic acid-binding protein
MFAQVVARAKACGNQIGFADAAIAAITMTKGFHLATCDVHDLRGTGVVLINPFDA